MWIVLGTLITSRIWLQELLRWMLVFWSCLLSMALCLKLKNMYCCVDKLESITSLSLWIKWIWSSRLTSLTLSNLNLKIYLKNTTTILKNLPLLEDQLSAIFKILTLKSERRVLKLFYMPWILKLKFQADPSINLSIWQ